MTNRERILQMIQKWPEDIPFEKALYHMYVLKELMEGLKDAEEGRVRDFDDVFNELERLNDEEDQASDVGKGRKKSEGNSRADREGRRAKNGRIIHTASKKVRKSAS